ncbi:MAG: DUF3179 domain-containing protein [Acidimicrobiia bacterium]
MNRTRLLAISAAFALVAVACGGGSEEGPSLGSGDDGGGPDASGSPVAAAAGAGALPVGPSALDDMRDTAFPASLIDPSEVLSGGPPPDGIPSIDNPVFLPVLGSEGLLEDQEAVVALEVNGEARAYPVQLLIWHEIVNDTVGGVPVAVTYCPLCNSAVTYVRTVRGVETTFGTSGRLFASALVMYDRATESLWTHFDGRAVIGILAGDELEAIASPLMSWADFKDAYPDAQVMDPASTGFSRDYGRNPYVGYDDEESFPFLYRGTVDERAKAKQRVVGVTLDGEARAYSLDAISGGEARATNDTLGELPLVILWKAGQSTALEEGGVGEGRDVGSVGVFSPVVAGRPLSFSAQGSGFVDAETSSTWTVAGEAVEGELAGARLERFNHLDTFWFAWATYQPGTELVEG